MILNYSYVDIYGFSFKYIYLRIIAVYSLIIGYSFNVNYTNDDFDI